MRLRADIRTRAAIHFLGCRVNEVMALRRAFDAVGPRQAGIEPLGAVRGDHLCREHVGDFVMEGLGVRFAREEAPFHAPVGPAAGEATEHLAGIGLAHVGGIRGGNAALQPFRDAVLAHLNCLRGHARLTEVFLGENIDRDLRPAVRHHDVGHLEDDGAVGVHDAAGPRRKLQRGERTVVGGREAASHQHGERIPKVLRAESNRFAAFGISEYRSLFKVGLIACSSYTKEHTTSKTDYPSNGLAAYPSNCVTGKALKALSVSLSCGSRA